MIQTMVLTNDNHLSLLRGFAYLWNKYAGGKPVTIYGFNPPPFTLPDNFAFRSLGPQLSASEWSRGLHRAILDFGQKSFVLMLEDFWLCDYVDWRAFNVATRLIDDTVLRVDLSGNRAAQRKAQNAGEFEGYDIVETPAGTPYQMSFQAAVWHSRNLLKVLNNNENPWDAEILGSARVDASGLRVLGTKPAIMKYQPVWRAKEKRWQLDRIKTVDIEYLKGKGWLSV